MKRRTGPGRDAKTGAEIRQLIAQLDVPEPWDRAQFIRNMEEARGRRITLISATGIGPLGAPCGLWLVREHDDIIVYEDGTSDYHVDQIVLHEIGHMLLGHDKAIEKPEQGLMLTAFTPHIDPMTVKATLGRAGYSNRQERDAELFASLVIVGRTEKKQKESPFRFVFFNGR
jgi:hypothetical protein